jgi:flagellar biosynthesis/type III secretory pathway chaperone
MLQVVTKASEGRTASTVSARNDGNQLQATWRQIQETTIDIRSILKSSGIKNERKRPSE